MNCKILKCPICGDELCGNHSSIKCGRGHSFDISAKGYVNLLKINSKKSINPGDGKEMLDARRKTLDRGFYTALCDEICSICEKFISEDCTVVDAGCGEGFYLERLKKHLDYININADCYGFDISKYAVAIASKNKSDSTFFVASAFDIPIKDKSCDILLRNFAPNAYTEFRRILKKNGILVSVTPGREHLIELKKALYENAYFNEPTHDEKGFEKIYDKKLFYKCELNAVELSNLFLMTPYAHKTSPKALDKISKLERLNVTFDFDIAIYKNS